MPKNPLSKQLEKMSYNDMASDESIDISVANEIGYKKSDLSIVKIPVADLIEYSDSRFEDVAGRPQPFKEYSAEKLKELSKSIEEYGVLQPISVRPYNGKYQIMAGRNRTRAAILAGKDTVPAIIYPKVDDMQAAIIMLDTNLKQRRNLSYSELGFAYRMRMELMNRRGRRSDLYKDGQRIDSLSEAGTENSQSRRTVSNLIRLTYLIPELLELVDKGKLGVIVGVQLSYLSKESQIMILDELVKKGIKISKSDAEQFRKIEKERELNSMDLNILCSAKEKPLIVTISTERLYEYEDIIRDNENIEELFFEFLDSYKRNFVQPLHKV